MNESAPHSFSFIISSPSWVEKIPEDEGRALSLSLALESHGSEKDTIIIVIVDMVSGGGIVNFRDT